MAFKDVVASLEPTLRPLLGVSERLLAVAPIAEDASADVHVSADVATLLEGGPTLHRVVPAQRTPTGSGTIAHRWAERLGSVPSPQLAVTDQRLLIFTTEDVAERQTGWQRWFTPAEVVARQVYTVPREGVLGAAQAPGGRQRRGRLVIGFADGSGCVLVCSPAGLAEGMARAIEG